MRRSIGRWSRATSAAALAAVLTACPGSSQDAQGKGLTGEWRATPLRLGSAVASGTMPGWIRTRMQIDAAGNVTLADYADSFGLPAPPSTNPIQLVVDASGVVTQPVGPAVGYRGKLGAGRDLLVATATQGGASTLRISQRIVPGTTYAQSDLAGTWNVHVFATGTLVWWEHSTLTVASDGTFSRTSVADASGPQPDSTGKLLLSADGFVTKEGDTDATWSAFMSSDKSLIVGSHTATVDLVARHYEYEIVVLTRGGSGFSTGALAGEWQIHMANQNLGTPTWAHSGVAFSSGGDVSFHDWADSLGGTTAPSPAPVVAVAADGTVTQLPAGSAYHGSLSADGNLLVATTDRDAGAEVTLFLSVR